MHARRAGSIALLVTAAACGSSGQDDDDVPVVDPIGEWTIVGADSDPFADHRPTDARCDLVVRIADALEIEMAWCPWASVTQPASTRVRKGDRLGLAISHGELSADEPAEGHVALWAAGSVLWERTVAIPAAPGDIVLEIESPIDIGPGDPVHLHVHNHGLNTWRFGGLVARPTGPVDVERFDAHDTD